MYKEKVLGDSRILNGGRLQYLRVLEKD